MSLKSYYIEEAIEAGCDEAGRGCLAGPVFAAAVIFPKNYTNDLINDSKLIKPEERLILRNEIEKKAICWSVEFIDNNLIDKINILKASILAMHKALENLTKNPEHILIDGNRFYKFKNIPHTCIVKGDSKYLSIAAASILAKTYRDEFMENLHKEYHNYNWHKNKGYATMTHRQAILKYGLTPYHRKSFQLINNQLKLKF